MRIVRVWIVAVILIFTISVGWWTTLPLTIGVSNALNNTMTNPQGRTVAKGVEYVSYAWGPVFILFILLWAIMSSQKYDAESRMYG